MIRTSWFLTQMESFLLYCKRHIKILRKQQKLIYVLITVSSIEQIKCKRKNKLAHVKVWVYL